MQEVPGPMMTTYQVVGDVVDRQLVGTGQDRAVTDRVGTPGLMVKPEIRSQLGVTHKSESLRS